MKLNKFLTAMVMSGIVLTSCVQGLVVITNDIDRSKNEAIECGADITTAREEVIFVPEKHIGLEVPDGDTRFKSYMDYRTLTNHRSDQWHLQEKAETDENGLRVYDGCYMVALGSYYSTTIGDKFRITLDTGVSFDAVLGDMKADCHTDYCNQYFPMNNGQKNVVEFIVDVHELNDKARVMGDISYINGFKGNVTKIERIYDNE